MSSVEWLAESIRVSFLGDLTGLDSPLFATLLGVQPAEVNEKPLEGTRRETVTLHGYRTTLSKQPGRLDLLLTDSPQRNVSNPSASNFTPFYAIDNFHAVARVAGEHAQRILQVVKGIERLAYSPVVIANAANQADANRMLALYLPSVQFNPDRDIDIFWQINRPRRSNIGEFDLNRLAKWQTLILQFFPMQFGPGSSAQLTFAAARVEMDISTPASFSLKSSESGCRGRSSVNSLRLPVKS